MFEPERVAEPDLSAIPEMTASVVLTFSDDTICNAYLQSLREDLPELNFISISGGRSISIINAKASLLYRLEEAVEGVATVYFVKETTANPVPKNVIA